MPLFEYEVRTRNGERRAGTIEGVDQKAAEAELLQEGHFIMRLRPSRASGPVWNPFSLLMRYFVNPLGGGVPVFELAVFFRQLGAMLRSGIALLQAMRLLSEQGESSRVRKVASECVPWIEEGRLLSDAFSKYPWIFSDLQISIIKAGELSGDLQGSAERIAHYLEWEYSLRQKLRLATLYPKILVAAVIFLPKIVLMITDGFMTYFAQTGIVAGYILLGVLILWALYRWINQFPQMRYGLDLVKLSVPKVGGMIKMLALSKFYRSFGAMYTAGVPLQQGLRSAAESTGNAYLAKHILDAVPRLDRGYALVDAMIATGVMPRLAVDMLQTAKATGNVDEMMGKLAEYTENEAEVSVMQSTVILGLLLLLAIGGYIGYTVVQFYVQRVPQY